MHRSILISVLVIGAVLAIVAGVGTYATFTDTDSSSGDVKAGTVDISANAEGPDTDLAFTTGSLSCPDNLAIGDACTADVTVTNNGSLAVDYTGSAGEIETAPNGGSDCFSVALDATLTSGALAASGSATGTVTVTLDNPGDPGFDNKCQGASDDVTVTIDAVQS